MGKVLQRVEGDARQEAGELLCLTEPCLQGLFSCKCSDFQARHNHMRITVHDENSIRNTVLIWREIISGIVFMDNGVLVIWALGNEILLMGNTGCLMLVRQPFMCFIQSL